MSRINPAKLSIEDFPEQRSWIGKMFELLNQFTGDVNAAFQNAITIGDNLYQEIKEITFKNSADQRPIKFRTKFNSNPRGLVAIYLYDNTSLVYAAAAPWIVWSFSDSEISISSIAGLTSGHSYTIRIWIVYG